MLLPFSPFLDLCILVASILFFPQARPKSLALSLSQSQSLASFNLRNSSPLQFPPTRNKNPFFDFSLFPFRTLCLLPFSSLPLSFLLLSLDFSSSLYLLISSNPPLSQFFQSPFSDSPRLESEETILSPPAPSLFGFLSSPPISPPIPKAPSVYFSFVSPSLFRPFPCPPSSVIFFWW